MKKLRILGWVLTIASFICIIFMVLGMFVDEGICTWFGWDILMIVFTIANIIAVRVYLEKKNK